MRSGRQLSIVLCVYVVACGCNGDDAAKASTSGPAAIERSGRSVSTTGEASKLFEANPMVNRNLLASKIMPLSDLLGKTVDDPEAVVQKYEGSFLAHGSIYRITREFETHPLVFTVGTANGPKDEIDYTALLAGNPDAFFEVAKRGGVQLDTAERREQYLAVFLETTRDFGKRFQRLRRADDIRLLNKATEEQRARYDAIVRKYAPLVEGMKISQDGPPWKASLYVLIGDDLVHLELVLDADGKVTVEKQVVEKDLPIAYAR